MIFICVKWKVKPEYADQWVELTKEFTEATRSEPGNLFFDWSRSVEDPHEYVLVEAFKDDAAEAHVTSEHFRRAQAELPQYVAETPRIRNVQLEGDHWDGSPSSRSSRPASVRSLRRAVEARPVGSLRRAVKARLCRVPEEVAQRPSRRARRLRDAREAPESVSRGPLAVQGRRYWAATTVTGSLLDRTQESAVSHRKFPVR